MTTLIVNEKEKLEIQVNDDASVFDVLLAAQEKHWDPTCSIDKLTVNGENIEPLNESSLMGIPAVGVEINISLTAPRNQSIAQIIADADVYLTRLAKGFEELSGQIRGGAEKSDFKMLLDGIEGLMTILELANSLVGAENVPQDMKTEFTAFVGELNDKAEELTEAQEGGDPTLIADIIEYEFSDSVRELQGYLNKIAPMVQ